MNVALIKLFLRFGIGFGFLSAVADRFGFCPTEISTWGTWEKFLEYNQFINPWVPVGIVDYFGILATGLELVFGICLIVGFKTESVAKFSGYLMLLFALAIAFSVGIKGAFDYSVFAASGAAFALSLMKEKNFELDQLLS